MVCWIGDVQRHRVDRAVGHQLVELDYQFLVVGVVVADQPAADHQPLGEAVERLGLVRDRVDLLPELRFGQKGVSVRKLSPAANEYPLSWLWGARVASAHGREGR